MKLSKVSPKNIIYKNDGTSRDTYISFNGGGFHAAKFNLPLNLHEKKNK
jgi:hypothetical protein